MPRPPRAPVARAALCAALALLPPAACGDPVGPLPDDGPPLALDYRTGGFLAFYTTVRVAGDTVVRVRTGNGRTGPVADTLRRVPSADEWRAFWGAMREAGVRGWPTRCERRDVVDGGGFTFDLAWRGGRRGGSYTNSAPRPDGRCSNDDFDAWNAFADAVDAVASGGTRTPWPPR